MIDSLVNEPSQDAHLKSFLPTKRPKSQKKSGFRTTTSSLFFVDISWHHFPVQQRGTAKQIPATAAKVQTQVAGSCRVGPKDLKRPMVTRKMIGSPTQSLVTLRFITWMGLFFDTELNKHECYRKNQLWTLKTPKRLYLWWIYGFIYFWRWFKTPFLSSTKMRVFNGSSLKWI